MLPFPPPVPANRTIGAIATTAGGLAGAGSPSGMAGFVGPSPIAHKIRVAPGMIGLVALFGL